MTGVYTELENAYTPKNNVQHLQSHCSPGNEGMGNAEGHALALSYTHANKGTPIIPSASSHIKRIACL